MKNYDLENQVIEYGLFTSYVDLRKKLCFTLSNNDFENAKILQDSYDLFMSSYGEAAKVCERLFNAYRARVCRLKKRISYFLTNFNCYFLTLTFDSGFGRDNSIDILETTSRSTRRKYVIRYLKSISDFYVGNIDFGKINGREHYHAVVVADSIDLKWQYGFQKNLKVVNKNDVALSKYIAKLTNHAIKETCGSFRLIYSKF